MKRLQGLIALTLVVFAFASSIQAQEAGISTSASETITVKPQKIRLSMWVQAQGSDIKNALKSLNDHKARVKKDLLAMKADEASVVFGSTRLSEGSGAQQDPNIARYKQMMMRQMQANGGDVKMPQMPEVFTAIAALKADWTLPVQEGDALAILPTSLKAQIVARDIAGENNKPELDDDQQEQMEELKAQMDEQYGVFGSDDSETGPSIMFVADVTAEQVQAATKTAFESAVKKAESLVGAIGLKLGSLRSVASNASNDDYLGQARYFGGTYGAGYGGSQLPASLFGTPDNTVTSQNVDELVMSITVSVNYAIGGQ